LSIKGSTLLAALAVGGFGALMAILPGSPIFSIFNPPLSVAFPEAKSDGAPTSSANPTLEIITLLPKDGIPAIMEDRVSFLTGAEAAAQMLPSDRIIGLSVDGDHRAYSTAQLSSHEVVNDTVGGIPVAVTW
jgi:hypothetical protein